MHAARSPRVITAFRVATTKPEKSILPSDFLLEQTSRQTGGKI